MSILDKFKSLTVQLLPSGRAFKMPYGGEFQKLRDGLVQSEKRAYDDARSVLDSILPDNDNFSEDDTEAWERRLGLLTNEAVSLADRKLAIRRKLNHPGGIKARQHYLFLQRELQAAGFDVAVHENFSRLSPFSFIINPFSQHGDFQHGDSQHGGQSIDRVANSVLSADDLEFDIGVGFSNVFFIGGDYLGDFADVDADRELEFRELILRIKPLNQIAFLHINYV